MPSTFRSTWQRIGLSASSRLTSLSGLWDASGSKDRIDETDQRVQIDPHTTMDQVDTEEVEYPRLFTRNNFCHERRAPCLRI